MTRHEGKLGRVPTGVCLLLTHSATLFTIFEAEVTASSLRATRQLVAGLLSRDLRREACPRGLSATGSSRGSPRQDR